MRPGLAFRVGVVGHRDLEGVDAAALADGIREVLGTVRAELATKAPPADWGYSADAPRLFLISSLAEGVDQLAARVATEAPLSYELRCPLPFQTEAYLEHFDQHAADARREFERLASLPDTALIELNAAHGGADERRRGYGLAADLVLEHSDLLLAVLDSGREGKVAGTAETLRKAVSDGIPVVRIDPREPSILRLVVEGEETTPGAEFAGELRRQILNVVAPHRAYAASGEAGAGGETAKRKQRAARERFFREPLVRGDGVAARPLLVLRGLYLPFWRGLLAVGRAGERLLRGGPRHGAEAESAARPPDPDVARVQKPYGRPLEVCDELAGFYMDLYRGSFSMNYALGALAVLFALLSYFHTALEAFWLIGELAALACIALNVVANRIWKWQDRAVEYRFLAEYFRHTLALAPLARVTPWTRLPAHNAHGDPNATWMNAYFRAVLRGAGVVGEIQRPGSLRLAGGYLGAARHEAQELWLLGQCRYHARLAHRFHFLHHLLHGATLLFFLATVSACLLHLGHLGQDPGKPAGSATAWREGALLTILAGACPAFLAAIHGLLAQAEFHRIAQRSKALAGFLGQAHERMAELEAGDRPELGVTLGARSVEIAGVMLEEVLEWRMIYMAHATQLT